MNQRTKKRMTLGGAALGALMATLIAVTVVNSSSSTLSTATRPPDGTGAVEGPEDIKMNGRVPGGSAASGKTAASGNSTASENPTASRKSPAASKNPAAPSVDQQEGVPLYGDGSPNSDAPRPREGLATTPRSAPGETNFAALASLREINVACGTSESTSGPSTTNFRMKTVTDVTGIDPALLGAADLDRVTGFVATWSTGSFGFPFQPGTFFEVPGDARFPCPGQAGFRASNRGRAPAKECRDGEFRTSNRGAPGKDCPEPDEECPDVSEPMTLEIAVQALSGDAQIGRRTTIKVQLNHVCPPS